MESSPVPPRLRPDEIAERLFLRISPLPNFKYNPDDRVGQWHFVRTFGTGGNVRLDKNHPQKFSSPHHAEVGLHFNYSGQMLYQ